MFLLKVIRQRALAPLNPTIVYIYFSWEECVKENLFLYSVAFREEGNIMFVAND